MIFWILFGMLATAEALEMKTYTTQTPHMVGDGFRVFNYFPGELSLEDTSPFVLLDYQAPHYFPPTNKQRGVGGHPHRGFETVTLVYEGKLAHKDSKGGQGVIGKGDVQWMTAASGVLHEEFHEKSFSKAGGVLHCVQLWVNLPKAHKMGSPKYQTLLNDEIPHIKENGADLRVIAGSYKGAKGVASTFTPIELYDVKLEKRSHLTFSFPKSHNSLILLMDGALTINGETVQTKELIRFKEKVQVTANQESFFLVLSGEPINEPIIQSGPFVMNTDEEIEQAHEDFSSGKFGYL